MTDQTIFMILVGVLIATVGVLHYWDKYCASKEDQDLESAVKEDQDLESAVEESRIELDEMFTQLITRSGARRRLRHSARTRRKPAFKRIITHENKHKAQKGIDRHKTLEYARSTYYKQLK